MTLNEGSVVRSTCVTPLSHTHAGYSLFVATLSIKIALPLCFEMFVAMYRVPSAVEKSSFTLIPESSIKPDESKSGGPGGPVHSWQRA